MPKVFWAQAILPQFHITFLVSRTVLRRRLRRSELAEVFEHGETLRLQFPKEDLGYVYAQGAGEPSLVWSSFS